MKTRERTKVLVKIPSCEDMIKVKSCANPSDWAFLPLFPCHMWFFFFGDQPPMNLQKRKKERRKERKNKLLLWDDCSNSLQHFISCTPFHNNLN